MPKPWDTRLPLATGGKEGSVTMAMPTAAESTAPVRIDTPPRPCTAATEGVPPSVIPGCHALTNPQTNH